MAGRATTAGMAKLVIRLLRRDSWAVCHLGGALLGSRVKNWPIIWAGVALVDDGVSVATLCWLSYWSYNPAGIQARSFAGDE